jgi:hypothetical protein
VFWGGFNKKIGVFGPENGVFDGENGVFEVFLCVFFLVKNGVLGGV